jgi:hypothetical protein
LYLFFFSSSIRSFFVPFLHFLLLFLSVFIFLFSNIVSSIWVTINGVWVGNRIYFRLLIRTLWNSLQHTLKLSVFPSRWSVAASNDGVPLTLDSRTNPMPQLPASNSNSKGRSNLSSSLTDSLTNQLNSAQTVDLMN